MKTTITALTLISMFAFPSHLVFSQISLEKTYTHSVYYTQLSEGEDKLFLMDVLLGECRIYNLDHSLYKTIKINLDQDYYLYDINHVTRNLFNDDNTIELLYLASRYYQTASPAYYQYVLGVLNESGTSLLKVDLGNYYDIQKVNNQNKLLVWLYDNSTYPFFKSTNIYNIGGSLSVTGKKTIYNYTPAYPNPAHESITIPLDLPENILSAFVRIFSGNGKLLKEYMVDGSFKELLPDISGFSPGTYHYTITSSEKELLHSNSFSIAK